MCKEKKHREIANKLGIPPSTLTTILKNRYDIKLNGIVGKSIRQIVK